MVPKMAAALLLATELVAADTMIEPPQAHELAIPRQQRFSVLKYGGESLCLQLRRCSLRGPRCCGAAPPTLLRFGDVRCPVALLRPRCSARPPRTH